MCFSATASFTAAAVLAPIGVYSLTKAKPNERLLAGMPLLFAIQQCLEGIQWLFINHGTTCQTAGYGFLLFAFLLWPIYAPMAVMAMEPDAGRRKLIQRLVSVGAVISVVLLGLTLMKTLTVQVYERAIFYNIGYPASTLGGIALAYALCVCAAFVMSSHFWVRVLGLTTFVAAAFTAYAYTVTYTSVWCFCTAVLSVIIGAYFFTKKSN